MFAVEITIVGKGNGCGLLAYYISQQQPAAAMLLFSEFQQYRAMVRWCLTNIITTTFENLVSDTLRLIQQFESFQEFRAFRAFRAVDKNTIE